MSFSKVPAEGVEWQAGDRRFRAWIRDGVVRVERRFAAGWVALGPTESEAALREYCGAQAEAGRERRMPPIEDLRRWSSRRPGQEEERASMAEARACLDVAFSVLKADLSGACTPTMGDIVEAPPKLLLGMVDSQTGLPDWVDPNDSGRFGVFERGRSKERGALSATRVIATAVFEALSVCGWGEVELKQLARMYPRSGPYSTGRVYRDSTSKVVRLSRQAERILVGWDIRRRGK